MKITGLELKLARTRARILQVDLAARMGMPQSNVSQLEMRAYPRAASVARYMDALNAMIAERGTGDDVER